MEFEQTDRTHGTVDGVLYFHDGSRLEFTEVVALQNRRPVKQVYRYSYVRADKEEFRYDNAAHHPRLLNFPHPKHVGRKKLPATEPTLSQVMEKVTALLRTAAPAPPTAPKRRRQAER